MSALRTAMRATSTTTVGRSVWIRCSGLWRNKDWQQMLKCLIQKEREMKKTISMFAIAPVALGLFATNARSKEKSAGGFDRLKTLVGDWEATPESGKAFISTIRAVSNGTRLEEAFDNGRETAEYGFPLHAQEGLDEVRSRGEAGGESEPRNGRLILRLERFNRRPKCYFAFSRRGKRLSLGPWMVPSSFTVKTSGLGIMGPNSPWQIILLPFIS